MTINSGAARVDIFDTDTVIAALDQQRPYRCKHCTETFMTAPRLGGHVHAAHPEVKRALPKFLRQPRRAPRPSLKRATDVWPAKP